MPAGRPSKYKDKYVKEMLDFFAIEPFQKVMIEEEHRESSKGTKTDKIKWKTVAAKLPMFETFARRVGVAYTTLLAWSEAVAKDDSGKETGWKYPDFHKAYNACKLMQKEFLIQNGLAGHYPPASFIFVAKNITDLQDIAPEVPDDKLKQTRDKIKDFLNEPTDYTGDGAGQPDATGAEPATEPTADSGAEVAPAPPTIS